MFFALSFEHRHPIDVARGLPVVALGSDKSGNPDRRGRLLVVFRCWMLFVGLIRRGLVLLVSIVVVVVGWSGLSAWRGFQF